MEKYSRQPLPIDPAMLTHKLGGRWYRSFGVAPCPVCQTERRDDQTALTIRNGNHKLLLNCKKSGCEFRDILASAGIAAGSGNNDLLKGKKNRAVQAEKRALKQASARALWARGKKIIGTKGEVHLRSRGITCDLPSSLRWVTNTYHTPSGGFCSMMVGDVAPTGGVHRTFFTKTGLRLTSFAKMMLGPCGGGAVRLSEIGGPLVVCEGIETGLSLLSGMMDGPHQIWATLSTSGMKSLVLPEHTGHLIVATDSDDNGAGANAGEVLAQRARAAGWAVSLKPAPIGQDWNDVLQGGCTT